MDPVKITGSNDFTVSKLTVLTSVALIANGVAVANSV